MIAADPRPMFSAPVDGTPVRLFVFTGCVIASFWTEERCREVFGGRGLSCGLVLTRRRPNWAWWGDRMGTTNPRLGSVWKSDGVSEPGASLAL